jgi:hypothetical protein
MVAGRVAVVALTFLLGVLFLPRGTTAPQPQPTSLAPTTTAGGATTTTAEVTTTTGQRPVIPPVAPDTTPPLLRLPSDLSQEATSRNGAQVRFAPSAADQVDGPVPVACTPASGSTFPVGTTPVGCSAVDRAGFAASGIFTVTVFDSRPPILDLPTDLTEEATSKDGAQVRFAASATDRVDGPIAVACTPASGNTFPLGATAVSCSAIDAAGFAANRGFTVTVADTKAPKLTLPGDLSVQADSAAGAAVIYTASAEDSVDGAITPSCSPASGQPFPVGTTRVRCSATDAHGNDASGGFAVLVLEARPGPDKTPPALELPKDMTVEATSAAGAAVAYPASASDLVDGQVPITCSPPSGATFALGTTKVTCTATDKAGNTATGTFTVTVRDTKGPEPDRPSDMTVEATSPTGAEVTYTASATDLVDGRLPMACTPPSGGTFPLGTTTVTCSATDKAGNTGTASFTIIVQDRTAPRFTLPEDLTVEATSGRGARVRYQASATDLVDGPVPITCTPASGATFALGTTQVTCTATDKAGNTATGTFTVTVRDTTAPVLKLPRGIEEQTSSPYGETVKYAATAKDRVDGRVQVTCTPPSGSTFPVDATTVTCSASDRAGNTATGSFQVTVRLQEVGANQPPSQAP